MTYIPPPSEFPKRKFPGIEAANPDVVENDQEIVVTFKLKTHGSTTTANALIEYIKRQMSVMIHNDVELIDYDVQLSKDRS